MTTAMQKSAEPLDAYSLLARAIDAGANIDTVSRLVALAQEMRAVQAREAWYAAMASFQRDCPSIKKTLTAKIPTRQGSGFSYRYAPLDEILATIQPVLGPLGLSVSWRSPRVERDHVYVSCRVAHALGHFEDSGEIAMPIVLADPGIGATPPQRVGIALTYARRYSLLAITGLAPEDDDDASHADTGKTDQDRRPKRSGATLPQTETEPESGREETPPEPWELTVNDYLEHIKTAATPKEINGWRQQWQKVRQSIPDSGQDTVERAFEAANARVRSA